MLNRERASVLRRGPCMLATSRAACRREPVVELLVSPRGTLSAEVPCLPTIGRGKDQDAECVLSKHGFAGEWFTPLSERP